MAFIIIETHGGAASAIIVTDPGGNNLVFDIREEAEQEAVLTAKRVLLLNCRG